MATTQTPQATSRCTLCPAGCELGLAPAGPDTWRSEYPTGDEAGLCPRGSAMGELIDVTLHADRWFVPAEVGFPGDYSVKSLQVRNVALRKADR